MIKELTLILALSSGKFKKEEENNLKNLKKIIEACLTKS